MPRQHVQVQRGEKCSIKTILYPNMARRVVAGQKSDVKEVQALCMITIAKMVQAAKATQIQQHLPQLVPALLDSLSGMEVCHPLHHFCCITGCPVAEGADADF